MALTISEANAINVVLLGHYQQQNGRGEVPGETAVRNAAHYLAGRANGVLHAGVTAADIERWHDGQMDLFEIPGFSEDPLDSFPELR